jgi:phage gpG-like protein
MARVFGLTITGIDKTALVFAMTDKKLKPELEAELFRQGTKVQVEAQRILTDIAWVDAKGQARTGHVITGTLRRSIRTQANVTGARMEVVIGTNIEYAPYIEALPDGGFMFSAYMAKKDEVLKGLQNAVNRVIREAKGG